MNIKYRQSLNESEFKLINGQRVKAPTFGKAQRFFSPGVSLIYTTTANFDGRNGIKAGDLVYFKANNARGVGSLGRTDETCGSCEDIAEVLGFYLIRNLNKTLSSQNKLPILKTTPYDFAEYHNDDFWNLIAKKTNGIVESDRMYGCISKNCLSPNAEIIRGDVLLHFILDKKVASKSSSNNLFNYQTAVDTMKATAPEYGHEMIIDPITIRYLANTMFFDYFYCNSDRHYKNVNFQKTILPTGEHLFEPIAVIDNGGGLSMQAANCQAMFSQQQKILAGRGKFPTSNNDFNPFNVQLDFYAGKEAFSSNTIRALYDKFSPAQQIATLASQNRVLFEDLKGMYQNLDFTTALTNMRQDLSLFSFPLPELEEVAPAVFMSKKEELSEEFATLLGEEFDSKKFDENPDYYLEKFDSKVKEDKLTIGIATDDEIKKFAETYKTQDTPQQTDAPTDPTEEFCQ